MFPHFNLFFFPVRYSFYPFRVHPLAFSPFFPRFDHIFVFFYCRVVYTFQINSFWSNMAAFASFFNATKKKTTKIFTVCLWHAVWRVFAVWIPQYHLQQPPPQNAKITCFSEASAKLLHNHEGPLFLHWWLLFALFTFSSLFLTKCCWLFFSKILFFPLSDHFHVKTLLMFKEYFHAALRVHINQHWNWIQTKNYKKMRKIKIIFMRFSRFLDLPTISFAITLKIGLYMHTLAFALHCM